MTEELPPFDPDAWQPKTALGRAVKSKEITDIDTILDEGRRILEPQIGDPFRIAPIEFRTGPRGR